MAHSFLQIWQKLQKSMDYTLYFLNYKNFWILLKTNKINHRKFHLHTKNDIKIIILKKFMSLKSWKGQIKVNGSFLCSTDPTAKREKKQE